MNKFMMVRYGICFSLLTNKLEKHSILQYTFMGNTARMAYSQELCSEPLLHVGVCNAV